MTDHFFNANTRHMTIITKLDHLAQRSSKYNFVPVTMVTRTYWPDKSMWEPRVCSDKKFRVFYNEWWNRDWNGRILQGERSLHFYSRNYVVFLWTKT